MPKVVGIIMLFVHLNKASVFDKKMVHQSGLNSLLCLPMTNEGINISEDLKKAIQECVDSEYRITFKNGVQTTFKGVLPKDQDEIQAVINGI